MVLTIGTTQELLTDVKSNPDHLKELVDKNPAMLNILMLDGKDRVKYVKLFEEDQKKLTEAKRRGVAEGVVIGLAVALFFALMGDIFK